MSSRMLAAALVLCAAVAPARAQYYPPPSYGYGPPGSRCDARFRTPYGPRQVICPMGVAKPVGARCACPPPDPYGPAAHGRVIP